MVRGQVLAFAVGSMLVLACGSASRDPGTMGGGKGDPDAGGPGAASLTVAPASRRVLAGTGAVTLQATLVGAPGPISWALSGPGTLGTTSGAETTYTPPASIAVETVVTITATAGPGLSATVHVTVAPAATMEVHGTVVGALGGGLAGLTVGIGQKTAITRPDGSFSIAGVVPPYDLNVVLAGTGILSGRYESLTRPDPTIVFFWLFRTDVPNTATISGSVSGGDPVGQAGEFTAAFFTTTDVPFAFSAIGITSRNNPYTLPIAWFGPDSISATVRILQWRTPGSGSPPTAYTGYGLHPALPITRDGAVEGADVALVAPGNASIAGTVVPPEGYTVSSKALALDFDGLTTFPLGHVDTPETDFQFVVPEGIPTTSTVTASARRAGEGTTLARVSGILPRQVDVSLALPAPAIPTSPADGARVPGGTSFSWTPLQRGVHVAFFNGGVDAPSVFVVTTGTSARMELPGGASYRWMVTGFGPFAGIDDFAAGPGPSRGSFQTASEARTFVVE